MEIVCPICSSRTKLEVLEGEIPCPRCEHPLTAAHREGAEGQAAGDDALVAELRDAFGSGAHALKSSAPRQPAGSGHSSDAVALPFRGSTLEAGTRLADFEIVAELGRGGMGIVYRARQMSLNREVALKVLPAVGLSRGDDSAVVRFQTEAQAAARLHHTNIVPVYAQGECPEGYYYAMELIEGGDLGQLIRQRADSLVAGTPTGGSNAAPDPSARTVTTCAPASVPTPGISKSEPGPPAARRTLEDYRRLARLVAEVADGLEHAHRHGVIHRDIKPHNLLVGPSNRLHITDFGLARLTDRPHLTRSGEVMGTPAYLSPEQVEPQGGGLDHRTDIYSLGATLYELITWRRPFRGETREQIISGIRTTEPEPPRRVDGHIPLDLETICLRALEKEPQRRFPSAADMAEDLRRFADGRPILSRRIGPLSKAIKWASRHRAATVAIVASAAVVLLVVGLTLVVTVNRHQEAARLLDSAYHQIVHLDHRHPGRVLPDVERARELGADPIRLAILSALAQMEAEDLGPVIEGFESVLIDEPDNIEFLYMLARAQWHARQFEAFRQTIRRAERLGDPDTPEGWLFRGLAIHNDRTEDAIEAYRMARELRVAKGEFFPAAALNLARAYNQLMYRTRSIETFANAADALENLVDNGYYGSYPYYLLSISHRLAAEIYSGSRGARDDLSTRHYEQALKWATDGQQAEPESDRPIAAKAEALESMLYLDDLTPAIDARSEAIAREPPPRQLCEQYHYRWRLHYWQGNFDQALDDLQTLDELGCADPEGRFYTHVYPALVHAELGDLDTALALADDLAERAPDAAQEVLWSATLLRLLGQPDRAQRLLDDSADRVDYAAGLEVVQTEDWVRALYDGARGVETADNLLTLARDLAPDEAWKLSGEANFHIGVAALVSGDRAEALERFCDAYRAFDGEQRYTYHAKIPWLKLQRNPDWPAWIPETSVDASDPRADHEEEQGSPRAAQEAGEKSP